jgi:3-oxoacyl-[acyl-carrier-protein] synthase-1
LPPALGFENVDEDIGFAPITKDESVEQGVFLLNYFGFGGNSTALVVSNR